jgi:hypothetical protein
MKFIVRDADGAFDLRRYEDYLDREGQSLRARLRGDPLLSLGRFVPSGPESLHDARLASLLVGAPIPEFERDGGVLSVELRLKGPYFDRQFELRYEAVSHCSCVIPGATDDLLMHEIVEDRGGLLHELVFDREKTIAIACRSLTFTEVLQVQA